MVFRKELRTSASVLALGGLTMCLIGCHSKGASTIDLKKSGLKPPPNCMQLDSASTPVKGCCGSMSFHAKNEWKSVHGSTASYCTRIPKGESQYYVAIDDPRNHIAPLTGNWVLTVNSYMPGKGTMELSREGITLSANLPGCEDDNDTIGVTLATISPHGTHSGDVGFYQNEGPQSKGWGHNRRFRDSATYADYDCTTDRDMCERIGGVSVNGSKPVQCDEADCMVMITEVQ